MFQTKMFSLGSMMLEKQTSYMEKANCFFSEHCCKPPNNFIPQVLFAIVGNFIQDLHRRRKCFKFQFSGQCPRTMRYERWRLSMRHWVSLDSLHGCKFQFIVLSKSNYLRCHPERRQTNSKEFACRSRRIYTLTLLCRSNQRIDPSTRFACSG